MRLQRLGGIHMWLRKISYQNTGTVYKSLKLSARTFVYRLLRNVAIFVLSRAKTSIGFCEIRLPAGAKSEGPLYFGPIGHVTVRTDQVWETELFDEHVNEPWARDSIDCLGAGWGAK